ncbi:unnamed protein product [Clonostachys rhizophaga]|uniref:Serine aminopeptidase S33 domain-containing protein n=1 Tax=Clonostachys rhizophaga TaxID=160324 RepID=A0A9N9YCH7_9HYPO|nr:unnamed protein product [Clonostachys rhizophaga]
MSTTTEGQFELQGGVKAYTKTWTPSGPIRAHLVFVHGFSEHINRYNEFFATVAEQGIQVLAWDQRGWGRTSPSKADWGNSGPTTQVIADVAAFVKGSLAAREGKAPLFVMGHSMGGGEVCTLMGDPQYAELVGQVRGWLLECPFIGFVPSQEPSFLKVFFGRLAGRVFPHQKLKFSPPPEYLSRVPEVVESIRADPMCHDTGTLEALAGILDRTAVLASGTVPVRKEVRSLWLAHGTEDKVCSYDSAKKWFEAQKGLEDKTFVKYEGGYHQLHADLCKEQYGKDMIAWILEKSEEGKPVEAKL